MHCIKNKTNKTRINYVKETSCSYKYTKALNN